MRIRYSQRSGVCDVHIDQAGANVIPLEWRREWLINLYLTALLATVLLLMLLSIYLVFTKPAPVSVPTKNGAVADGSPYAEITSGDSNIAYLDPYKDSGCICIGAGHDDRNTFPVSSG